jgi:hypothetical protein
VLAEIDVVIVADVDGLSVPETDAVMEGDGVDDALSVPDAVAHALPLLESLPDGERVCRPDAVSETDVVTDAESEAEPVGDGELLPLAQKDAVADTECEFVTDAEKE